MKRLAKRLAKKRPSRITEADKLVGARLRQARLLQHKSQTEVATQIGVTYQQLQRVEMGYNRISAARLQVIAGYLDKPIGFFVGDDGSAPSHPDAISAFATSRDSVALAEAFNTIKSPAMRSAIVALAEAAAEKQS